MTDNRLPFRYLSFVTRPLYGTLFLVDFVGADVFRAAQDCWTAAMAGDRPCAKPALPR